ncbi:MAG TPA: DMT family transporter [Denitromonas sp.]|uniref:DMT family transporter n=1 Tax=Denitromonas sp. TaxID=2734609 RepID=UPI001D40D60B|nr:DMT family transporter [Rhodocyclaceae bacterium]MCP5223282.1 DMT family transporter [Zoogloeaceae bacterium]HQU88736.1 DMT family transporter [Denitromonas sp.]HQV15540.1 DMT family transporter [Denitromonas sp.]
MTHTHLDPRAAALMILLCTIWGLQQVAIKLATPDMAPVLQSAIRSIGAVGLVWLWARHRGINLRLNDGTLRPGLLAGVLFAGEFALLYWALLYTSASRGVIFLYTAPFIVSLAVVWRLPNEHMRPTQWAGLALAFAGVLALFGEGLLKPAGTTWIGDMMMLGAAVLWAGTTLTIKFSRLATAAPEKTLLYQLAVSAAVLSALALALGETRVGAITPTLLLSLGFQIVIVAAISYAAWFWLIRHYPATRLSAFSFLTPVMGVLAGVVFLDEPLTPPIMIAMTLVGVGIWLANRRPRLTTPR